MKKLVLLLLLVAFQVSFAQGQACGKSVPTISLKFESGQKPPAKVTYELFYLAPKNTAADYNDYERYAKFLSQFLHDNSDAKKGQFWLGYETENPFIKM